MKIEYAPRPQKGVTQLMYVGNDDLADLGSLPPLPKGVKIGIALGIAYILYRIGTRNAR